MSAKTKNHWLTDAQKQEIYALGEAGIRQKDIAKSLGVSIGTIGRLLIEAGITRYETKRTWRQRHEGV